MRFLRMSVRLFVYNRMDSKIRDDDDAAAMILSAGHYYCYYWLGDRAHEPNPQICINI